MTEPEKAALHSGMTKVRRLEITHKAIATIMPNEEEDDDDDYADEGVTKTLMANRHTKTAHPKMSVNRAQMEMMKRINGGKV
jgi:hypothetical protein